MNTRQRSRLLATYQHASVHTDADLLQHGAALQHVLEPAQAYACYSEVKHAQACVPPYNVVEQTVGCTWRWYIIRAAQPQDTKCLRSADRAAHPPTQVCELTHGAKWRARCTERMQGA